MATPELRFVDEDGNSYPDWETTRLEEVANIEMGQSPPSSAYNKENMGLPLIQGNADREGRKSQPRVYTKEITKKVFVGDIIMSVRAPAGTVFKSLHNACIGRGVCAISVLDPTLNSQSYLYQKLLTLESEWEKHSQGSTFLSLTGTQIKAFSVFSPSLPEQQKIANLFSLIDEKIENIGKQVYLWKQYKQGLSQQLFSQQLRFVDDNGNPYPEWKEKKLGEICKANSSKISANSIEQIEDGFPVYGASGTIVGRIENPDKINDYVGIVKDGAGAGRVYYRHKNSSLLGTMQYIQEIENNSLGFIFHYLSSFDFSTYKSGSTIPHIYFKNYSQAKLDVPSLPEQQKIANLLSTVDEKIKNLENLESEWKLYKQALMQEMFV